MKNLILLITIMLVAACKQQTAVTVSDGIQISGNNTSGGAYFTNDQDGNPVLCWTGGDPGSEQLHYSIYNKSANSFGPAVVVPSKGISFSPETMNKVAFRKDGAIIAVFSRKQPTDQNKYAGSLLFSQSFDNGKTWTTENFVHTDTMPDNSRSYFDIATLPDGEVGIVWLDGRLKRGRDGSSLFFTKTNGRNGLLPDKLLAETVCQCCRTDIHADAQGNVHVVYRDIDQALKGQVRDFAHIISNDNGNTFSSPVKISNDNWLVDGCPHTGASLGSRNGVTQIVWYTAGGVAGLYTTQSSDNGKTFRPREFVSESGRHPQMVLSSQHTMIVWQESRATTASVSQHHGHHADATGEAVMLQVKDVSTGKMNKYKIDDAGEFPVITTVNESNVIVAYTKSNKVIINAITVN